VLLAALSRGNERDREAAAVSLALFAFHRLDLATQEPSRYPRLDSVWRDKVVDIALRLLSDTEDPIWSELAWIAASLGQKRQEVAQILARQAHRSLDREEEAELAGILAATRVDSLDVRQFLKHCLSSEDPEVVIAGIDAVGELPLSSSFLDEAADLVKRVAAFVNDEYYPFASAAYGAMFRLIRLPQ